MWVWEDGEHPTRVQGRLEARNEYCGKTGGTLVDWCCKDKQNILQLFCSKGGLYQFERFVMH